MKETIKYKEKSEEVQQEMKIRSKDTSFKLSDGDKSLEMQIFYKLYFAQFISVWLR